MLTYSSQRDVELPSTGEEEPLLRSMDDDQARGWDVKVITVGLVIAATLAALGWNARHSTTLQVRERMSASTNANDAEYGNNAWEGDILTTPEVLKGAYGGDAVTAHFGVAADNVIPDPVQLWPDGVVYYQFDASVSDGTRANVAKATAQISDKVPGITFKQRINERNFIQIVDNASAACTAWQGLYGRGAQPMNLHPTKCPDYVVVHEFMHALGFWHEQSRPDADQYVELHEENMMYNTLRWFTRRPASKVETRGSPYDYESLMHYDPWAFSKNKQKTITPRADAPKTYVGNPNNMGQRGELSPEDIKQMQDLYPKTPTCRRPIACKFPFVFKDYSFSSCTTYGHTEPWCAYDSTFQSGRWMDCRHATGQNCGDCPCVFPFTYNGKQYDKCTTDGDSYPWCSLNATYTKHYIHCSGHCPE